MAAPTQAYPPWLSPQLVTVTQDGVVIVQTSVVQLPQTYYGPSIPLGPGWVFGGTTFPASIATSFSASSPSSTPATSMTSAIPTSSQSQITESASSSVPPSSSSPTPSSPTPSSPTPSSPIPLSPTPTSSTSTSPSVGHVSNGLSSGTRLAIILSTILGTLMLAALLLVLFRIRRRVRRRRNLAVGGGLSWSFINSSAVLDVEPGAEEREGAENEGAAFLTDEHTMQERSQRIPLFPSPDPSQERFPAPEATALAAGSPPGSIGTKAESSTLDSEAKREDIARFNASSSTADARSLFFNPGRGNGDSSAVRRSNEAIDDETVFAAGVAAGHGIHATRPPGAGVPLVPSRSSFRSMITRTASYFHPASPHSALDESPHDNDVLFDASHARETLEVDAEDQLLPPRPLDPDNNRISQSNSAGSRGSWTYPDSPPSETDERATLLTARRVNLGQVSSMLASPANKKSLEGWTTPPHETEDESRPISLGSWSANMSGLSGIAKGLGRLSWFRRMESVAGPSGTRHSSPTRSRRGTDSRPPSARLGSASRPHSSILRPQSGMSFRSLEAEFGLRPPGMRAVPAGSGSGSGSGKSGATVYHDASSRPHTPHYRASAEYTAHDGQLAHAEPTMVLLPPDLDLGEGRTTIRSVDVLDLPVPERSLPFGPSILLDASSRGTKQDTVSSKGSSGVALAFPPGLISVPKWDRDSHSGSSNREARDVLEEEPPQAGGEWSSLRSKASASDVKVEGSVSERRPRGLVTRSNTGEQAVQVVHGEHAPSETASIATGPRLPSDQSPPIASLPLRSPRSVTGFGISLTPRMSMYASSRSDVASHSGDGSYSSQPSRTASHLQGTSQPSSNQESDDGHPPLPQGTGYNRASLSAIGGEQGPPQIPPLRPLSNMQAVLERTEDRETEGSDTSRPGTGTSRPMSDLTHAGTFVSGTGSTGVPTTVPSTTDSKR